MVGNGRGPRYNFADDFIVDEQSPDCTHVDVKWDISTGTRLVDVVCVEDNISLRLSISSMELGIVWLKMISPSMNRCDGIAFDGRKGEFGPVGITIVSIRKHHPLS